LDPTSILCDYDGGDGREPRLQVNSGVLEMEISSWETFLLALVKKIHLFLLKLQPLNTLIEIQIENIEVGED